ncbi:hypothetical protein CEUSTIGMA_g3057.t1 [Chlamydomonas eustigma]|uniref:Flavanone 4-reductase n=1 Tax=Chlamydomonas eustigma TaxID=1157962 RepID=A0A250WXP9_9CHLO|nr:hypothetical protein CEUSTIGMA_g3057.t1 [Chlamydomonas eustigma]|eukprot:GAX75613.1 hypothetical protein CEUSTIGMA_g3057.t1 [Chlamydomonas eustigma]
MPLAVVTGCTGYVGSELCRQLLKRGFNVRGTVRSIGHERSSQLLNMLKEFAPEGSIDLVEADLLQTGSFDEACKDADFLFHVASPFVIFVEDQQQQLIDPAVTGTRNVMEAAAKHKHSLKRIVLTSSVAAVHDCHQKQIPKRADGKWSEEDFNETSTLEGSPPEGYWLSKVLAEKEAWTLAKQHGLDLVIILPEFVMGPALTKAAAETSTSAGFMKGFLEAPDGKVPEGDWMFSDVRDVALSHILAAINPAASGRYIISQPMSLNARQVTDILKAHLPGIAIPDGKESPIKDNIDNTKVQTGLGLEVKPIKSTITDMVDSLISLGFTTPSYK